MIPLSVPNIKGNELKYVSNCIKTEWISFSGEYKITNAQKLVKTSLCLPSNTNLTKKKLIKIVKIING